MTQKRSRGRPRGTGKNDQQFLAMIADLVIKPPGMAPTTAMKRIVATRKDWNAASPEAAIRRWQEKWSKQTEALLAAAKARAEPKPVLGTKSQNFVPSFGNALDHNIAQAHLRRQLQEMELVSRMMNPPFMKAIREMQEKAEQTKALFKEAEMKRKEIEAMFGGPSALAAHLQDAQQRMKELGVISHLIGAAFRS